MKEHPFHPSIALLLSLSPFPRIHPLLLLSIPRWSPFSYPADLPWSALSPCLASTEPLRLTGPSLRWSRKNNTMVHVFRTHTFTGRRWPASLQVSDYEIAKEEFR
ncbi:hypothetical protein, unlikely [Trypanosoma congolense IL3000]|uniref:Uncharacterized protein n=1 Tax=Trypanosoma congolense (strain IL3000) TaxID=1068625 RepID=F9W446_TRYCI|nr:hypothetical protein, unlikely [Trypanosoma congolense IL3000]